MKRYKDIGRSWKTGDRRPVTEVGSWKTGESCRLSVVSCWLPVIGVKQKSRFNVGITSNPQPETISIKTLTARSLRLAACCTKNDCEKKLHPPAFAGSSSKKSAPAVSLRVGGQLRPQTSFYEVRSKLGLMKINPTTFSSARIERSWTFTNTLKQRSAYET